VTTTPRPARRCATPFAGGRACTPRSLDVDQQHLLLTEDARPAVATVARDVLAAWAASNPDALAAVLAQAAEAPARRRR
jgi:hypothetical protein